MKNDMLKKVVAHAVMLMMIFSLFGLTPAQSPAFAIDTVPLRILEVEPGTTFKLPGILTDSTKFKVDTMTMKLFIADKQQLNGKYDIIYIGNTGGTYTSIGAKVTSTARKISLPGTVTNEYYSANDITDLKAKDVKDFIESKQLLIFEKGIFSNTSTKIYSHFSKYIGNLNYNVKQLSDFSAKSLVNDYNETVVAKKPVLYVVTSPVPYTGPTGQYETKKYMEFLVNVSGLNRMDLNLYIDGNGDGLFGPSELVKSVANIATGDNYSINFPVPETFAGLQPWKLELVDRTTQAKNYVTGETGFKTNMAREIKVLQIVNPSGNSFDISNLGASMLTTSEYVIKPTKKTTKEVNSNSKMINDYDMIIMGFKDSYSDTNAANELNAEALRQLQIFIDAKRGVLFTHDTMTFYVPQSTLTQTFRNQVGQDIYPDDAKYGWSDPTIKRYENGEMPTYTNAQKINQGLTTQYPFPLEDVSGISTTHAQYFQLNLEDPEVVPYYSLIKNDPRNQFYMYSKGSITYSGTGHANPGDSQVEKKLFINTIVKAIRGANNAPAVEIFGITEGQNIISSQDNVTFSYTISDIDEPKGSKITANIYLDLNNDGIFSSNELKKSILVNNFQSNEETLSLVGVGSNFRIRVEAVDRYAANAHKDVNLTHANIPSINLTVSNKNGYLIGDSDTLVYTLSPLTSTLSKNYNGLSLISQSSSTNGIPFRTNASWSAVVNDVISASLPDLHFTSGASTWQENKTLNLPVTFTEAMDYTIMNKFTYSENNQLKELIPSGDTSYSLRVKEGHIGVDVKNNGKAVSNVKVRITDANGNAVKYTNDAGVTFTNGDPLMTGKSGHVTFNKLPSGTYHVSIDKPGYGITSGGTGNPAIVHLSYDNAVVNLEYGPTTHLIANPVFTDIKGNKAVYAIPASAVKTKFTFSLMRDTSTCKLLFDKDELAGTYKDIKLGSVPLTMDSDGFIELPRNLVSGEYTLTMTITPAKGTEQAAARHLNFASYTAVEKDVEDANEITENMGENALEMTIYKQPKIQ